MADERFPLNALVLMKDIMIEKLPLHLEYRRLLTFEHWPKPYISVTKLAQEGFFYLGLGDYVACRFCGVILHRFEVNDDPKTEHRIHSPNCNFVLRYNVNNVEYKPHNYFNQ